MRSRQPWHVADSRDDGRPSIDLRGDPVGTNPRRREGIEGVRVNRPVASFILGPVLMLAACGGASGPPIIVSGSVLILDPSNFSRSSSSCSGVGSFSEVNEGATVKSEGGGTATLSSGSVTGEGNCRFLFELELPDKDAPQDYEFKVEGMPALTGIVNTQTPIDWQSPGADGWVTLAWDI